MRVLNALGLLVELTMILRVDNSADVDIANNWIIDGCTRHMDEILYFLRYLKDEGLINTVWTLGKNNTSDLFANNLSGPYFNKRMKRYFGDEI